MKIDFKKEIMLDFKEQYPEDVKRYEDFFNRKEIVLRSQLAIHKEILLYCNLLLDIQFFIDLIEHLEKKHDRKKRK